MEAASPFERRGGALAAGQRLSSTTLRNLFQSANGIFEDFMMAFRLKTTILPLNDHDLRLQRTNCRPAKLPGKQEFG